MTDIDDIQHPSWCGETCPASLDAPEHAIDRIVVRANRRDEALIDLGYLVGVSQIPGHIATVTLQPNLAMRDAKGQWGTPGQIVDLLPEQDLSAAQARYLADVLHELADMADRISDGRPA